jgi:hypothetical protein
MAQTGLAPEPSGYERGLAPVCSDNKDFIKAPVHVQAHIKNRAAP